MKLPGTVPPKVQNVYVTPSAIGLSTSMTSSSTMTLAGCLRFVGGGTCGGLVSTAVTGSPCGGPKSPLRDPPVSATALTGAVFSAEPHPASSAAASSSVAIVFLFISSPRLVVCPLDTKLPRRNGRHSDSDQVARVYVKALAWARYHVDASEASIANTPRGSCARAIEMMKAYTSSAAK
jgi:hypothetical protein